MAKPSKKTIEPLLDEWARLKARALRIERQRDLQIAPQQTAFDKKVAPIRFDAQQRLSPLETRLAQLKAEITKQLESGIDYEAETVALSQVVVETQAGREKITAIAEVQVEDGDRNIDPKKFFAAVAEAKRDAQFWGCVKILVGKAEKAFGAMIESISKKPKKFTVKVFVPEAEKAKGAKS